MAMQTLKCRLNLGHDWHQEHAEDGLRYLRCSHCHKDETGRFDLIDRIGRYYIDVT